MIKSAGSQNSTEPGRLLGIETTRETRRRTALAILESPSGQYINTLNPPESADPKFCALTLSQIVFL